MKDEISFKRLTGNIGSPNTIDYNVFKIIVDRDISEVVTLEDLNDYELAGVR